jgi:hypothetical protein
MAHGIRWESYDLDTVAANAGSASAPRGCDSPGPAVSGELLPQQIGALLRHGSLDPAIHPQAVPLPAEAVAA